MATRHNLDSEDDGTSTQPVTSCWLVNSSFVTPLGFRRLCVAVPLELDDAPQRQSLGGKIFGS